MRDQLTRIQSGATDLLSHFTPATASTDTGTEDEPVADRRTRSGGLVDAPGKKHRPPPPSARGAKSDNRIAKLKLANTLRRMRQA